MKHNKNFVDILFFLLLVYSISAVGFFVWYKIGFELAAFIPIIAPVTSYFILYKTRKNIIKVNLKNDSVKMGVKAILCATFVPIVYITLCIVVYLCVGGEVFTDKIKLSLLLQLLVQWVFAAFCEEVGWRGYLLHALKSVCKKWLCYIICGTIWTIWHIPMIFANMILTGVPKSLAIILLCLECIFVTIILDKLMSLNKMNIWTCVSFHAMHNILIQLVLEVIPQKNYILLDDGGFITLPIIALTTIILTLYTKNHTRKQI